MWSKKGMALFSGFRTWLWFHAGRGTTPGVFGNRALTLFERGRIPHTRGRKSGLRALNECCYGVRTLWKICRVWSESRPAKKKGPGKSPGPGASRSQKGACSVASGASSEACELEVVASGSGSPRSSLRTASARMDHEVIFEVFAFLPLPFGRS